MRNLTTDKFGATSAKTASTLAAALVLGSAIVLGAGSASADPASSRVNPLDDAPVVRHRLELVRHRLELTPLFESTVNADFRHIVGGGLKLEYHLSDMFSIGAVGVASASINTSLVNRIVPTLADDPTTDPTGREPSQQEFLQHLNSMPAHGAAYISLTPWYGKLAAFSKAFVNFDFYFQAGVSFAQLTSNCAANICNDTHPGTTLKGATPAMDIPPDDNPNNDPPLNSGTKIGAYFGGGIHVFLNETVALDLTVRDYMFSDNPSGADYNADLFVSGADSRFSHHLFMGVGLAIMLPTSAKRTP